MPAANADLPPRVVVDETSFDLRGLSDNELADALHDFSEALAGSRRDHQVGRTDLMYEMECRDGEDLATFLYGHGSAAADERRRAALLLDRCVCVDEVSGDLPSTVVVDGAPLPLAFSIGYAARLTLERRATACLVLPVVKRRGFRPVVADGAATDLFFFDRTEDLRTFWREVYRVDNVAEREFFDLVRWAFPALVFAPTLRFGRFAGDYHKLRGPVVRILGVINDHFADLAEARRGQPGLVARLLRVRFDVNASAESKNTRDNRTAWATRTVTYRGDDYVCDWHAKIEPHQNRIHFCRPDERIEGRVLVGIFCEHLPT